MINVAKNSLQTPVDRESAALIPRELQTKIIEAAIEPAVRKELFYDLAEPYATTASRARNTAFAAENVAGKISGDP